ncbi:carbon storage regulator [Pseudidiomarina andamanensis]|uniref:Carbon storage regulator n=1 Tax=Pseudidiomarina andamanensis TaxID=1940690 RepID=A0AA92IKS8_9GAMM|nr:carbon storage regulator [Pseudidiomarina andamanensis]
MLTLTRKIGEEIVIDNKIRICVVKIEGKQVKLRFEADNQVVIVRSELIADVANSE